MPGSIAQYWGNNAKSFGDILDDEANHEKCAERNLADAVCRADGKPFAEIVEADSDCDHEGDGKSAVCISLPVISVCRFEMASSNRNVATAPMPIKPMP